MDAGQPTNTKKILTALAVLIAITVIVFSAKALSSKEKVTTSPGASSSETVSTDSGTPNTTSGSYKDGVYGASASYDSPGGVQDISISITLQDGKIVDTSATNGANDREAREFQNEFIAGYKKLIVGKSVDEVRLSRVSGSSLTSQGFNAALEDIKNDAEAI